ncbi:hypothetical protein GS988_05025 [Rhodococcus hoagii]|nr:hypothetical protein [Prescottella equi]
MSLELCATDVWNSGPRVGISWLRLAVAAVDTRFSASRPIAAARAHPRDLTVG